MLSGRIVASVITVQCLNEPKLRGTFTIHNFVFAGMVHTVHTSSAFQMHMMHYASKATKCRRAGGPAKAADRPLQST